MRIAIVGAGAIGGWLGVRLASSGHDVSILARGKTLEAIRRDGLRLDENGETRVARLFASDKADELGKQDLVAIAVKAPALAGAAESAAQMLGPDTAILPAMNGVSWWFTEGLKGPLANATLRTIDPNGRIAALLPPPRVVGCVVHASCSTDGAARIVHKNGNRFIIGEPDGSLSPRAAKVRDALQSAGFDVAVSSRIHRDVWYKLWGNMTMNPISALTGALTDQILDDELVSAFILSVMAEAAEIGRHRHIGCPIAESGADRMKLTRRLGAIKTSMLQDAEAGRPLEIDALLAAPREIAEKLGVATPSMDSLYGLVRLFETARGRRFR